MLYRHFMLAALATALLGLGLARPLQAGWGDEPTPVPAEQKLDTQPAPEAKVPEVKPEPLRPVIIEDKPSWEKYAFSLKEADGSGNVTFADLARTGDPFVLVWWLSDCPVCHMQMPYVQQLARLGKDQSVDIQVIGINIDDRDRDCDAYMREKKLSFNVLRDPRGRGTDRHYDVRDEGTPLTYVFKGGGEFAGKLSGYTKNYPKRVLEMLGLSMPEQATGNGISVQRADGTTQKRSFE
jgi:thiol-disulfide isomerase/thioredoxin